jgi:hypothetical protein
MLIKLLSSLFFWEQTKEEKPPEEVVEINGLVIEETEQAILLNAYSMNQEVWIPKSQIRKIRSGVEEDDKYIEIPRRLAEDRGIR